jgi:hypothetical protein
MPIETFGGSEGQILFLRVDEGHQLVLLVNAQILELLLLIVHNYNK